MLFVFFSIYLRINAFLSVKATKSSKKNINDI